MVDKMWRPPPTARTLPPVPVDGQALASDAGQGSEVTTIIPGDRGVPALAIRDHERWQEQVRAERRRTEDDRIKQAVAEIEQGAAARRLATTIPAGELETAMRANAALMAERRAAPARVLAETEAAAALLEADRVALPAEPPQPRRCWRPTGSRCQPSRPSRAGTVGR